MARDDDSESLHSEDTEDSELEASFDEADAEQLDRDLSQRRKGKRKRDSPDAVQDGTDDVDPAQEEDEVASDDDSASQSSAEVPDHAPKRFRLRGPSAGEASDADEDDDDDISEPEPNFDEVEDEEDPDPHDLDPDHKFVEPSAGPAYLGPAAAKPLSSSYLQAAAEEPIEDELASDDG